MNESMPLPTEPKMPRLAVPDPSFEAPAGTNYPTADESAAEQQPNELPRNRPTQKLHRVAIVGTAPESVGLAPYEDESWEIWTCSGLALQGRRFDRHFELHRYDEIARGWTGSVEHDAQMAESYMQFLARLTAPQIVYLQEADPKIPVSRTYPIDMVFEAFPERYFASTIAYMIALAIMEGADEIGLWGVDMALSSEQYSGQRASAEWLLGIAQGMGITVTIPPEGDLLKIIEPYAYGTNNDGLAKIVAKKGFVGERLRQAEAERAALSEEIAGLMGALDGLDYVSRCWQGSSNGG